MSSVPSFLTIILLIPKGLQDVKEETPRDRLDHALSIIQHMIGYWLPV